MSSSRHLVFYLDTPGLANPTKREISNLSRESTMGFTQGILW